MRGRLRVNLDPLFSAPCLPANSNDARAQMATPSLEATDLAALTVPVLVIHGGGDPIFPIAHARWAVDQIPDARLVELADMGHALDPAFFDVIAGALTDF